MEDSGVKTCGVHWLTFATKQDLSQVRFAMGPDAFGPEVAKGGYGHPYSQMHWSGATVFFGRESENQPVVVNVPGDVCDTWASDACRWARGVDAWATRIDLAVDLGPSAKAKDRLLEMRRSWQAGEVVTHMDKRSHRWFEDDAEDGGRTAYFGGKSANIQLRAYDRRGPLRLEFQWRGMGPKVGAAVPRLVLEKDGPLMVWRRLAKSVVFPMPWYRELMQGDAAEWQAEPIADALLVDTIKQIRTQYGVALFMLKAMGIPDEALLVVPDKMRPDLRAKGKRFAAGGDALGYDGDALRRVLDAYTPERSK